MSLLSIGLLITGVPVSVSAATVVLQGSATAVQGSAGSAGSAAFGLEVLDQAEACGLASEALSVQQRIVTIEPRDETEETALNARVEAISAQAGFTGPEDDLQVSRATIRALLTTRLLVTLIYNADDSEASMACLTGRLIEAGFSPLTEAELAAISDASKEL